MKNFGKILGWIPAVIVLLVVNVSYVVAQGQEGGKRILQDAGIQDVLLKATLYEINNSLNLTKSEWELFKPLYSAYFYDMRKAEQKAPKPRGPMSDQIAEQSIREEISQSKSLIAIRESYYEKFKRVISPIKIQEVFEIEREISRRIIREAEERKRPRD